MSSKLIQLSYSSFKEMSSCQQKYAHRKIYNTPVDKDHEESDALGFGKAFHHVLELTNHESFTDEGIKEAMKIHGVEVTEFDLLKLMLQKYVTYHLKSGLKVVKCELPIATNTYIGFIDAIAIDDSNGFWIIDLKTAGKYDANLLSRLPKDMQMNLYAKFADDLEIAVEELKGRVFKGCRYRVTTKSISLNKATMDKAVKVYDIEIPVTMLDPESAWNLLQEGHGIAIELNQGVAPKKNYNACMDYFKPCAYFSQCHGEIFSEANTKVKVHTIDSLTDGDLL